MNSPNKILELAKLYEPEEPRPLMREIPSSLPYPVGALGNLLSAVAQAIHKKVQAPLPICAQSVLAAGNLAAQGHVNVRLHTGQIKPISLQLISILESGGRKSSCDALALAPVREKEEELSRRYRDHCRAYQDALSIYESEKRRILKDKKLDKKLELQALGPAPMEPLTPILVLDEATPQALFRTQGTGQPSLGIFSAEGGLFIGGHGMSADFELEMASVLSKLWDGDPCRKLRAGAGLQELKNRRFNMHLMIQPEVASLFLADPLLESQGLLSRVLVTAPTSMMGSRQFHEMGQDFDKAMAPYYMTIRRLLDKPHPLLDGTQNELALRTVELSLGARKRLIAYSRHIESQLGPDGEMEAIRSLGNKLTEHAARLACTIATMDDLSIEQLSAEQVEAGIMLAEYYAAEALRLKSFAEMDTKMLLVQRVLDWLRTRWKEDLISLPDIYQYAPTRKVKTRQEAQRAVALLEEHGWLVPLKEGGMVGGKKRNEVWRIIGRNAQ